MDEEDKTSQSSHNYSVAPDESQNAEPALYSTRREKVIKPLNPGLKVQQAAKPIPANKATTSNKENPKTSTKHDLSKIYPENTREQYRPDVKDSDKITTSTTKKARISSLVPALQTYLILFGIITVLSTLLAIGVVHILNIYNTNDSVYSLSAILKTPSLFISAGLRVITILIIIYLFLSKSIKGVGEILMLLLILECLGLAYSFILNLRHITPATIAALLVSALFIAWLFFIKSKVNLEAAK